jgi:hypothetical protein
LAKTICPWPAHSHLVPWAGSVDQEERLHEWAWTLGYALLAGAERLFALSTRDFEVVFEAVRAPPQRRAASRT